MHSLQRFQLSFSRDQAFPQCAKLNWSWKKKCEKGKLEEGKILNNWWGGLLWVDWLELRQLRKYFFLSLLSLFAPKMVPLSNTSWPQCWFPSTKNAILSQKMSLTGEKKRTIILMNKLALFNVQPHRRFISSWKCKVNLQTAKFNDGSIHQKAKKREQGRLVDMGKIKLGEGK